MLTCTAPKEGHITPTSAAKCPVHGAGHSAPALKPGLPPSDVPKVVLNGWVVREATLDLPDLDAAGERAYVSRFVMEHAQSRKSVDVVMTVAALMEPDEDGDYWVEGSITVSFRDPTGHLPSSPPVVMWEEAAELSEQVWVDFVPFHAEYDDADAEARELAEAHGQVADFLCDDSMFREEWEWHNALYRSGIDPRNTEALEALSLDKGLKEWPDQEMIDLVLATRRNP